MRTRTVLFVAFVVVPLAEIAILIAFGNAFGFWWTFGLVVATALLGSWLVSLQGRATIAQVQSEFGAGQLPGASIAHGAMILIAGAFLLTPGLMTDAVGFMLLIPAIREGIRRWLVARYADRWIIIP